MIKRKNLILLLMISFIMVACSPKVESDKLQVVTSFTIISNMVKEIGGDKVEVANLVPTGTDPHEYEVKPKDIQAMIYADVILYNGLNLEGGQYGWLFKTIVALELDQDNIFALEDGIIPRYLTSDNEEDVINPHAFLSPKVGIKMSENVVKYLVQVDPVNKTYYEEQAAAYLSQLEAIDQMYEETINALDPSNRLLVTSERAFQYMNADYGLEEAYIWEIDTEELGTTEQLKALIEKLKVNPAPVLFVESNVDTRPMETISRETSIPIYERPVYSDELGLPGSAVDTYIKLLEYNIDVISSGLNK